MPKRELSADITINNIHNKIFIGQQGPCSCSITDPSHSMFRYYFQQGLNSSGLRFSGVVCVKDEIAALGVVMGKYREKIKEMEG